MRAPWIVGLCVSLIMSKAVHGDDGLVPPPPRLIPVVNPATPSADLMPNPEAPRSPPTSKPPATRPAEDPDARPATPQVIPAGSIAAPADWVPIVPTTTRNVVPVKPARSLAVEVGISSRGPESKISMVTPSHETLPPPGTIENRVFSMRTSADYLLWAPRRAGQDFAIWDPQFNAATEGSVVNNSLDAASGFRVRLDGIYNHGETEDWNLAALFTYFHTSDDRALTAPAGGVLAPTRTRPGAIHNVNRASGSANLDYKVFDLEMGRLVMLSDHFTIRLAGGGRFAWIDQKFTARYDGLDALDALVSSPVNFDGAGLRMGAEAYWRLGRGFMIHGKAFGTLLAGEFETRLAEFNNTLTPITNLTDRWRALVPVVELGLGIGWRNEHWSIRLGYEITEWFNLAEGLDLIDDVHQGKFHRRTTNLGLDGLTVHFGFTY